MNKLLLHIEGFAVLLLSIYLYGYYQFSWGLFFILLLAPDISMLGFLINKRVGTIMYNFFHTYSLPIMAIIIGVLLLKPMTLTIGLIWTAHIGMDRMIGYGLKYQESFKKTHLQRI